MENHSKDDQDDLSILKIVPAVGEKPNLPPKSLKFKLFDVGSSNMLPSLIFGH